MQADVLPLFFFNVDCGFRLNSFLFMGLRAPVGCWSDLRRAAHYIVGGTGWNSLGEFAAMVRNKLPAWVLLSCGMDLNFCAIHGTVIRAVGGPENQAIVFLQDLIFCSE